MLKTLYTPKGMHNPCTQTLFGLKKADTSNKPQPEYTSIAALLYEVLRGGWGMKTLVSSNPNPNPNHNHNPDPIQNS